MKQSPQITLLPFQPADQAAVKELVLAGLVGHWGFLDPAKNPDLDDIASTYKDAYFLVAWLDDQVIGTGALVSHSADTAEIVRMSVAAPLRRRGVGRRILQALIDHAKSQGYKRIILETTADWADVVEFYQLFGFQITHYKDGDAFFELELSQAGK
jgi:GNAT superfamily N-acetyltransferase